MLSMTAIEPLEYRPVPHEPGATRVVALAGNPNSGKTTLFNGLTGLRQKVANYPGVTVEKKTGRCKLADGSWINVIDLPGTYSLISRSPDEQVAMEVLRGLRSDTPTPDVVVVVVDASNLQRNLYLVSQLIELGRPMVVALNMSDIAERRGIRIDVEALSKELGLPVVPVVGHRKRGLADLKAAIAKAAVAPMPAFPVPPPMQAELDAVAAGLSAFEAQNGTPAEPARTDKLSAAGPRDRYKALAERLLIGDHAADVAKMVDEPRVSALLSDAINRLAGQGIDPMQADIEAHYRWIDGVAGRVVTHAETSDQTTGKRTLTDRVDAVLIHKVWGLAIFAAVMTLLFISIFSFATPIMDATEGAVTDLGKWVTSFMPEGPLQDLVKDGIFAGVGAVVVFVPQIALLFLFLAILEDSGYLARAAFLMDRLLSKVGLSGKAFIPLLSSFACAIPGIMATRTIENRRDRLATIFVAPFMSCSARLPVYGLLIAVLFANASAWQRGLVMFACYALGVLAAVGTAWVFKRTLLKGAAQAFILELPSYKFPQPTQVVRVVVSNTGKFLTRAGTVIFCLSVVLWAMNYYPRLPDEEKATATAAGIAAFDAAPATAEPDAEPPSADEIAKAREDAGTMAADARQREYSIAGRIGHFMEPAIRPLGYDWKMGVGLVAAFAAREVFVGSLGIVYSVGEVEDDDTALREQMQADTYPGGKPVWTPVVAVSLLVWFVLAMQCMSTLAIVRRETGGWTWPIFMLLYMNALAYLGALLTYQIGSRIWG
jgi:ferrous iron transport protein B